MTICGAVKLVNGRSDPLVCNLAVDHPGVHGIREAPGLAPYVRWGDGVTWTIEDERRWQARHTRKTRQ